MKKSTVLLSDWCRVLVVGGGSAGLGIASKLSRHLPPLAVSLVEPNQIHYYQPGFTLIGGGLSTLERNHAPQASLTPSGVRLVNDQVEGFFPEKKSVLLQSGKKIAYETMVLAAGLKLRFDLVEGLREALDDENSSVSTIYLPHLAEKTYKILTTVKGGRLLFTFPNTPIKCAGAPQKICYIADDIIRSRGIRNNFEVHYFTTLGKVFGVEKYANALTKVIQDRGISLHTRRNLVKVDHKTNVATFENLDRPGEMTQEEFSFVHVGSPCSPVDCLLDCPSLTDASGWVDVDPRTLQSLRFPSVFALGDCANTPNAKTAAAISSQLKVAERNIMAAMEGRTLSALYDGYASCPLLVNRSHVILAEFNSEGPLETFPFTQDRPSRVWFWLKRYLMPWLYWNGLIKGHWNGPSTLRRVFHPLTQYKQ